jgi:hypothetical protein
MLLLIFTLPAWAVPAAAAVVLGTKLRQLGSRARTCAGFVALAAASLICGAAAYATRDPGISVGRALSGASLAALAAAPALFVYVLLGAAIRRTGIKVALWLASLPPLAIYAAVVALSVLKYTTCLPDQYECPI